MVYLSNWKQYVKYNNSDSFQRDITYGVPQGSILGPILFIIYIHDLPFCVEHCKTILFADDTTIYKTGKHVNNIYEDMNKELQIFADCFRANKLSLNISKTKCMLFCRSPPPENENIILAMSNTVIQRMKRVQFLSLHIDEKPDWHEYINKCKNKLTCALYIIKKVNSYLPVLALKTILKHSYNSCSTYRKDRTVIGHRLKAAIKRNVSIVHSINAGERLKCNSDYTVRIV